MINFKTQFRSGTKIRGAYTLSIAFICLLSQLKLPIQILIQESK